MVLRKRRRTVNAWRNCNFTTCDEGVGWGWVAYASASAGIGILARRIDGGRASEVFLVLEDLILNSGNIFLFCLSCTR